MARSTERQALTVGVALLVLLSTVAVPGLAQSDTVLTVDDETALAEDAAVEEYRSTGTVRTNLSQADLQVTVAESAAAAGLDGPLRFDSTSTYLRLQYDEEIARTVRIYLPAEMITPRVKNQLDAENANVTADLRPTTGREYLAVSVTFSGETDATFALSKSAGMISSSRDWVRDRVENATGVGLPDLGSGEQWQYIRVGEYGPNQSRTFAGNASWTIQRKATRDGERVWLPVSKCDDPQDQPACIYETQNQTVLMTTQDDPPRIRYKRGQDLGAQFGAAVEDLLAVPSRISNFVNSLFGGGGG